jgi:hypothetical protein
MHPPLPTTSLLQASFWGQTTVHQTFFICEMHSWWTGIYTAAVFFFSEWTPPLGFCTWVFHRSGFEGEFHSWGK